MELSLRFTIAFWFVLVHSDKQAILNPGTGEKLEFNSENIGRTVRDFGNNGIVLY